MALNESRAELMIPAAAPLSPAGNACIALPSALGWASPTPSPIAASATISPNCGMPTPKTARPLDSEQRERQATRRDPLRPDAAGHATGGAHAPSADATPKSPTPAASTFRVPNLSDN